MTTRIAGAFVLLVIFCLAGLNDFRPPPPPPRPETAQPGGDAGGRLQSSKRQVSHPAGRTTSVPTAFLRDPLGFLSSAPPDTLALLPGIGPVIAERLADARAARGRFDRWEDVLAVKGIGPKKLDQLKRLADDRR